MSEKYSSIIMTKTAQILLVFLKQIINANEILPNKTLVLFDLDLTIFDRRRIMSDLSMERKEFLDALAKVDKSLVVTAYEQSPYELVENDILTVLDWLHSLAFLALGFTSRRTGKADVAAKTTVEEDASRSLEQLKISFSNIPPIEFDIPEEAVQLENPNLRPYDIIGKPKIYGNHHGVSTIFTANYSKELILENVLIYLSTLGMHFDTIFVIEDNIKNLEKLLMFSQKKNINFLGFHYTYALDHKKALAKEIVEFQKNYLIENRKLLDEDYVTELLKAKSSLPNETYKKFCNEVNSLFFSKYDKNAVLFKRIRFELETLASMYASLFIVQNTLTPAIILIYSALLMDYPQLLRETLYLDNTNTLQEAISYISCAMEEKRFQLKNYDRYDDIKNEPRVLPVP